MEDCSPPADTAVRNRDRVGRPHGRGSMGVGAGRETARPPASVSLLSSRQAENEALKTQREKGLTLKVSQKGAVSVYGLGRFPVTLYMEQWIKVLDMADDIRKFIEENKDKLKRKD